MNIFEQAVKNKLRFSSSRIGGVLTVEDLLTLPLKSKALPSLDTIAQEIAREIKASEEESFVDSSTGSPINELRLQIIKQLIKERLEENASKIASKANADRKQKLLSALEHQEEKALVNMTPDEIRAELKSL